MKLADLENQTQEAPIKFGQATFQVSFFLCFFTPEFEGKFRQLQKSEESVKEMAELMKKIIATWDLEDELSEANLARLGLAGMAAIFTGISEAVYTSKKS